MKTKNIPTIGKGQHHNLPTVHTLRSKTMAKEKFQIKMADFDGYEAEVVLASDSATGRSLKAVVLPHLRVAVYRIYKNNQFIDEFPVNDFSQAVDCFNIA